jgi:hypothetical protein
VRAGPDGIGGLDARSDVVLDGVVEDLPRGQLTGTGGTASIGGRSAKAANRSARTGTS